jgi:outer membrane protein
MKKGILLIAALCLTMTVSAQKKWSLQNCINYALQNNISLQKNKITKLSAIEDWKQSKAALLPSLSFSSTQSMGYKPWTESGTVTVSNGTVNSKVTKTYYNGSYGLNANYTLWNGNQNHNTVKLNQLTADQADLDSATTAQNLKEQIATYYVQILYLTEAIDVNKQSLETSKKNETRGKEMVEVGKMSKADLAQLTAQVATDQYNVVSAQSELATTKMKLKQLLVLNGDDTFDVSVPSTTDDQALATIPGLQGVYESALLSRPEIANSKLAIKSGQISLDIAKAGKLPTIGLSGGFGTSTSSMSNNGWGNQMKTNFDASIGATVSIPLFDNRKTRTNVNKAQLQIEQSKLDLQDKQNTLYNTIENYWIEANTNQSKFKSALVSVESQKTSYELLSEQFRLGLKNIVELLNGKTNLLTAQQSKLQSKYMTLLDVQLLKFYKGEEINL